MQITWLEHLLIQTLIQNNFRLTLKQAIELLRLNPRFGLHDWSAHPSGQPKWQYELRKTYHSLKDKNLISGGEFDQWTFTSEGLQVAYSLGYFGATKGHLQPNDNLPETEQVIATLDKAPDEEEPPGTISSIVSRKIRDTALSLQIKAKYQWKCQVCGLSLLQREGSQYAEAHHLKPLGRPHNGPDSLTNLIVLCPNHHLEFDNAVIAINPTTSLIEHVDNSNEFAGKQLLITLHQISLKYLIYHYERFKCTRQ